MNIPKKLRLLARFHFTDRSYDGPEPEPTLKIVPLGLRLDEFYTFLVKPRGPRFQLNKLDEVSYRDENFPIYCLDCVATAKPTVNLLVVGGSHGNEQSSILGLEPIIDYLEKYGEQHQNVAVRIIAPHNPVGARHFSRFNGNGIDVNRDFKKQATVETRAVVRAFKDFKPDFCLSLHSQAPRGSAASNVVRARCRDAAL